MTDERKEFLRVFGRNIYRLRTEQKLSQNELARRCGYESDNSRSTISKIEKGINDVSASQLKQIAAALDVTVTELIKNTSNAQEVIICDLIKEYYGSDACKLLQIYLQLDSSNRTKVMEYISNLI